MVQRVATAAQHDLMMSNIRALQDRVAQTMIQASSGKVSQQYSGVAPDSKRLVGLEATDASLKSYVASNTLIDQRLQQMETNTGQIMDIATQLKSLLVQATSQGNAPNMGLDSQAQTLLDQVGSLLNVQVDGRYLFSGSATNTAPVDLSALVAPPSTYPSTADTTYYKGDNVTLSTKAGPNLDVTYGVRADEGGYEELIRSLNLVKTAVLSPNPDTARLNEALSVVNQAIQDIPNITAKIGAARAGLTNANAAHNEAQLYVEQNITDISDVDVTDAITRLSADQTNLQASYATIAQLSNVSLLNYLK
ncbi:MAG: flagellin [Candidatus Eiseniibacteriota bacterium]